MAIMLAPSFSAYEPPRPVGAGAWSVAKLYPNTGQIVLQLGAQPPNRTGQIFAGATLIEYVNVPFAGSYTFTAAVEVGPLTLLPRGHTVAAEIIMGFFGGDGDREVFRPPTPNGVLGARLGTFTLCFTADLQPGITYALRASCGLMMQYSGTPNPLPYAEIIATYKNVSRTRVGAEAPTTQSFDTRETPEKEPKYHDLEGAEIGAIDGIVLKK